MWDFIYKRFGWKTYSYLRYYNPIARTISFWERWYGSWKFYKAQEWAIESGAPSWCEFQALKYVKDRQRQEDRNHARD